MRTTTSTATCSLLLVAIVALATGCASHSQTGVRIGNETLEQFKAGVTTEEWLVAILGKPTSAAVVEGVEATKVYRYALTEKDSGLFSFFTGTKTKNTAVVYFIITDGIVTRFWADRATEHTLLGSPVAQPSGEKAGGR